jgi:hypothetical protein
MYVHIRMVHRYTDTNQVKTHLMIYLFINNQICTQTNHQCVLYGVWRLSMRVEGLGEEASDLPRSSRAPRVPWRIFCCPARLAYREHGVTSSAHAPRSIRVCGLWGGDVGAETTMDLRAAAAVLAPRSSSTRTHTCRRRRGREVTWFVIRGGHAAAHGAARYRRPRLAVGLCSFFPL